MEGTLIEAKLMKMFSKNCEQILKPYFFIIDKKENEGFLFIEKCDKDLSHQLSDNKHLSNDDKIK